MSLKDRVVDKGLEYVRIVKVGKKDDRKEEKKPK